MLNNMKNQYQRHGVMLVVALTILTYALGIPFEPFIDLDSPAHVLWLRLMTCDSTCTCTHACEHLHYINRRLYCDMVKLNLADRTLQLEVRFGYLNTVDIASPTPNDVSELKTTKCFWLDPPACPNLVSVNGTIVLDLLNTITAQYPIQMSWSSEQGGWNQSSCVRYPVCAGYGCGNNIQSTMRETCQSHSECVDAESECRDGQCWCKPGLSHDPDTKACVAVCPGQYGPNFQIVKNVYVGRGEGPTSEYNDFYDIEYLACIDKCLSYSGRKVCTYAVYLYTGSSLNQPAFCGVHTSASTDKTVLETIITNETRVKFVYVQRDCTGTCIRMLG